MCVGTLRKKYLKNCTHLLNVNAMTRLEFVCTLPQQINTTGIEFEPQSSHDYSLNTNQNSISQRPFRFAPGGRNFARVGDASETNQRK